MAANITVDSTTPLKPFHKDDSGNFWTSDDIRAWQVFGYTYPDLIGLDANTTLVNRVNALYGPNAAPILKRGIATTGAPHFSGRRQYALAIQVHEFKSPGSLKIYAFLGKVEEEDASKWVEESEFVGTASILASSKDGMQETNSMIPLTPALEAKVRTGELSTMDEGDVATYLRRNLKWKVVQFEWDYWVIDTLAQANIDITNCQSDDAPGLQISVTWQEIEPARSADEFPRPAGEIKELLCAADGKKGEF
ncbi:hypothetical protein N0V90_002300 [Kalmusia sp. IMI 367209]|nr:hypothetical protein N0V90_002300 [Kalmusia sp. IMI 367209]